VLCTTVVHGDMCQHIYDYEMFLTVAVGLGFMSFTALFLNLSRSVFWGVSIFVSVFFVHLCVLFGFCGFGCHY